MTGEYSTSIYSVDTLDQIQLQSITDLYLSYYDASNASMVHSDLLNKTKILLLFFEDELVGFSTFEVYEKEWNGSRITVVYSGDTIVEREHWGQQALAYAWIRYIGELKEEKKGIPIYWFLIVKGHRTFKYLPAFTNRFYPHWSKDCSELKPLLNSLANEKFGNAYDPQSGVITFEASRGHLKEKYANPKENEVSSDAVRFFLEKNPGYLYGNELACICSLDDENLRSLTKRVLYGKGKVA